jgi:hypothetical protein
MHQLAARAEPQLALVQLELAQLEQLQRELPALEQEQVLRALQEQQQELAQQVLKHRLLNR